MPTDHPLLSIAMFLMAGWLLRDWLADREAAIAGSPNPKAYPGATPCSGKAVALACFGAVVIVLGITALEYRLGVSGEQSDMRATFLLATLGAAVVEELVFRGWLVWPQHSRLRVGLECVGISLVFALGHPFLWDTTDGLRLVSSPQAWISAGGIFALSLWLYRVRLSPTNPGRSLLPCMAAHAAHNATVFIVKLAAGHIVLG